MKFDAAYVWARLKEVGTWRMFAAFAGIVGATITDAQVSTAFAAFSALLVAYESFVPSHNTPPVVTPPATPTV